MPATSSTVLETFAFSEAKARLSDLMTAVVHGHRPKVIDRHHGKEEMFLLGRDELLAMLEGYVFNPKVTVSEGEFVVRLPELGVIAGGPSFEEAVDELLEVAEAYAQDYFERLEFFIQTNRREQLPWVARFAFTPADRRRSLLTEQPAGARVLEPA